MSSTPASETHLAAPPSEGWTTHLLEPSPSEARFAAAVRALGEAQLRAEIDDDEAARLAAVIERVCEDLAPHVPAESPGVRFTEGGPLRNDWGNAVVGRRNPVALPLNVERHADGWAKATADVGYLYEGAPDQLHGGFCAMLLDQVVCEAAAAGRRAGVTAYLHLSYHRPARIGRLHVEARVDRTERSKSFVIGHIAGDDGQVCVSAEALVIVPRAAQR